MKKIILVAGARPNFMKIAPLIREIEKQPENITGILVHTGQHYDQNMSESFFSDLGIKTPDYNLEVGSGSHATQTAQIMIKFEEICIQEKPDIVLVVGDVNSTIATGLVTKKLNITLAHVEAGLRSGDRQMPEEINRLATDAITDLFFTTEKEGTQNLLNEGQSKEKVNFVGHVMIDNLFFQVKKLENNPPSSFVKSLKEKLPNKYICMTMHRPSNVDSKIFLEPILSAIASLSKKIPIIFPCHPRTKKQIKSFNLINLFSDLPQNGETINSGLYMFDPMGYNDFLYLWKDSTLVLTDSGGLQEETTALKIPCITMRKNTERPITVEIGSNVVAGQDPKIIIEYVEQVLSNSWKDSDIPVLWDGKASERIINHCINN